MDESLNNLSVYELITLLCEKSIAKNKINTPVKKLRSNAYEILLGKRLPQHNGNHKILPGDLGDPESEIIAWQMTLSIYHNRKDTADRVDKLLEKLNKSSYFDSDTLKSILQFLTELKQPLGNKKSFTRVENRKGSFRVFDESEFHLPNPFICLNSKYSNDSFHLNKKRKTFFGMPRSSSCLQKRINYEASTTSNDELSSIPSINIWDLVSKIKYTKLRTWESFGDPTPLKEPKFLTESSPLIVSTAHNLISKGFRPDDDEYEDIIITQAKFIKDIKYLLIGIASDTFIINNINQIMLAPGVTLAGLSHEALRAYCEEFIFCGTCYKALTDLTTVNLRTGKYKQDGYIFAELCRSIQRYLTFYRLAALGVPSKCGLLRHQYHIRKLAPHLNVLSSICKVGPFAESVQIPHGVALLNYLYEKVLGLMNKDVVMVLFSVLYPCLQLYFNKFLRQWILDGSLIDPYDEFFIASTHKYLSTRGRTYWTRSFHIREDMVPLFLQDTYLNIFKCGKSMNLLKLCAPNSTLSSYLRNKKPNILHCCFAYDQLRRLESYVACYSLEVISELPAGKFSIFNMIKALHEEDRVLLNLIATKRKIKLQRLELEKVKAAREFVEKKRLEMRKVKEALDAAIQLKDAAKAVELEKELIFNENLAKIESLKQQIVKQESEKMVKYYEGLFVEAEKRQKDIQRHIEVWKNVNFEENAQMEARILDDINSNSKETKSDDIVEAEASKKSCLEKGDEQTEITEAQRNKKRVLNSEFGFGDMQPNEIIKPKILTDAQTNKQKMMNMELGFSQIDKLITPETEVMTEAQRNKQKMMNMELGFSQNDELIATETKLMSDAQRNKQKMMNMELGFSQIDKLFTPETEVMSDAQRNKQKMMNMELGFSQIDKLITPETEVMSEAQRNKQKMMNMELGYSQNNELIKPETKVMSELQRNRMKMMHVEFGFSENIATISVDKKELTEAQRNKLKVMNAEYGFGDTRILETERDKNKAKLLREEFNIVKKSNNNYINNEERNENQTLNKKVDNENFVNSNPKDITSSLSEDAVNKNYILPLVKHTTNLNLDMSKLKDIKNDVMPKSSSSSSLFASYMKSPNFEFSKPMSIDSTPVNEYSPSLRTLESASSAASHTTDTGFYFPMNKEKNQVTALSSTNFSIQITKEETDEMTLPCFNYFVKKCIQVPVQTQISLIENQLLQHFFIDLKYLDQLRNVRLYFFLLDGEFSRNITEGLFEKLYEVNAPKELINCGTLKNLLFDALQYSSNYSDHSNNLSFKINNVPKHFHLGDVSVLDCLSLTYKVDWPLNILLPSDAVAKYDEVFKFLLKLNRVSWILKKTFMDMKFLNKVVGKRAPFLYLSPHYQNLQRFRHIMTHFMQTLQNYIVSEVLNVSWANFEEQLATVENLDQIHALHTSYLKNILFMCLLNQRSTPIRKVLLNIFTVILKFYDYLRSRHWEFDDNGFVHPNYQKLETIFNNFVEFVRFLFKAGRKVARTGYQPQLVQLIDMLDINQYYSKNN